MKLAILIKYLVLEIIYHKVKTTDLKNSLLSKEYCQAIK